MFFQRNDDCVEYALFMQGDLFLQSWLRQFEHIQHLMFIYIFNNLYNYY